VLRISDKYVIVRRKKLHSLLHLLICAAPAHQTFSIPSSVQTLETDGLSYTILLHWCTVYWTFDEDIKLQTTLWLTAEYC